MLSTFDCTDLLQRDEHIVVITPLLQGKHYTQRITNVNREAAALFVPLDEAVEDTGGRGESPPSWPSFGRGRLREFSLSGCVLAVCFSLHSKHSPWPQHPACMWRRPHVPSTVWRGRNSTELVSHGHSGEN